MRRDKFESGQAGLIVMLIMVVLLTLGVSIATQSTQGVIQSRQEEESSRVFDAAEAGIEQALGGALVATSETSLGDLSLGLSGSYSVAEISNLEVRLDEGQVVGINTGLDGLGVPYAGDVVIEWSKVSDCVADDPASLIVAVHDSNTNQVRRYAYEGCDHSDAFLPSSLGANPYTYSTTITVTADEDVIRVKPVYNDTHVRVTGSNLPLQYHQIVSKATNDSSGETRSVVVDRTVPTAPSIFDYVLFSGTTITKN